MDIFEKEMFYRGMSNRYPVDRPYIVTPRKDRRPLNTDNRFHSIVDDWFFKKFGVYYRSQSVFLTKNKQVACTYAHNNSYKHVVRVIPLTPYNYCWSSKIEDLYTISHDYALSSIEEIESKLESLEYTQLNLSNSKNFSNEIMVACSQYIAIPILLNNLN
ncbi:hypothetical protein MCL27_17915 [Acinetobacter pittii]|uniref:hypothetical protein n=1 Tax=Acinetobacter pittii TaxID=48296 RepID=UPI001EE5AB81|nr:hypothetical protein [Acinetobacter pittii]MCG5266900.1 hypothetical protein [Acinetobacter pittii]